MNELEDRQIHNLFGFGINQQEFSSHLAQSDDASILRNVAKRVYFVRQLRYRSGVDVPPFSGFPSEGALVDWFEQESATLQLYLLCTCIDALGGSRDYLEFPQWLETDKKEKYFVDDATIRTVLGSDSGDLREPDVFRHAAAKVYHSVYAPGLGNQRSFLRFFQELPDAVKQTLADIYIISNPMAEKAIGDQHRWQIVCEAWASKSLDERTRMVAEYFYRHRRNAYTHRAETGAPRVTRDWSEVLQRLFPQGTGKVEPTYNPITDIVEESARYRIVRFWAEPGEDESLLLLLVVAVGVLSRLGYQSKMSPPYIQNIRRYYMRCERMYLALGEISAARGILFHYMGKSRPGSLYLAMHHLPTFPTMNVEKVRAYLCVDTTLEGGLGRDCEIYLGLLARLNAVIGEFHKTYFPQEILFETPVAGWEEAKARTYSTIQNMQELSDLKMLLYEDMNHFHVYRWFNDLADRMIWDSWFRE